MSYCLSQELLPEEHSETFRVPHCHLGNQNSQVASARDCSPYSVYTALIQIMAVFYL